MNKIQNNFEFSSLMVPIDNKLKGLIRLSIENKLDRVLELSAEVHRLQFDLNDENLVKTLMKSIIDRLDINPMNNDDIFNSISSKILIKKNFNYYQLEDLSMKFDFIDQYNDLKKMIRFPPDIFEVGFDICVRDIKRMQRFINSFLFNYQIIYDTIRYVDLRSSDLGGSPAAENESLFLGSVNQSVAVEEEINEKSAVEENENVIIPSVKTNVDEILEYLLVSPPLLSYLVHLIFNYYSFYELNQINDPTAENLEIKVINLFPHDFGINKGYIIGLLESMESVSIEKVNLLIKSLSKFLMNKRDEFKPLEIEACLFILFFYSLRHLFETNKSWIYSHLERVFSDVDLQIKILNKYIPLITDLPIKFEKIEGKNKLDEIQTNLDEISSKYKYIKELDQNQFAELVYSELKEDLPPKMKIQIGIKNLVDVEKLMNNKVSSSEFVKPEKKLEPVAGLVSYEKRKNPKIISKPFDLFMKYLENPIVVVTEKEHGTPSNVINLFEKLKNLLNDSNFKKEDISTLQYYHNLLKIVPDDFQFTDILFVIFQIIIPYMYYFYNLTVFEDVFLTIYKF